MGLLLARPFYFYYSVFSLPRLNRGVILTTIKHLSHFKAQVFFIIEQSSY